MQPQPAHLARVLSPPGADSIDGGFQPETDGGARHRMTTTTTIDRAEARRHATRSPWHVFLAAFALLFALSGAWAFASPLMSVPDEPAHTIHAAAVVRGEFTGEPSDVQAGAADVEVPEYVADTAELACFAFAPSVPASCQEPLTDSTQQEEATTSAGSYNPLYYLVVGLPSLVLEGEPALYAMRLLSAALSSALLAAAVVALSQMRARAWTFTAVAVAVTPMVVFIMGSVNPSSMEITSAIMLFSWASLLAQRRSEGFPRHRIALVVVAAVVLANTRSIGLLWLLLIVVATLLDLSLLRALARRAAFWVGAAVIGLGAAAGLLWTLTSQSLSPGVPYVGAGSSFLSGFNRMIFITFENGQGYVGLFGWIDTPAPATTVLLWGFAMLALIVAALVFGRGRARFGTAVLAVAMVLVPPIVQGFAVTDYGYIWQARYILAILTCLVIAAGMALDDAFPSTLRRRESLRLVTVGLVVLAVLHVHTVVWVFRRYVTGLQDGIGWRAMVTAPSWQPPLTWEVWTVVVAATVLVAGLVVRAAVARSWSSPVEPAHEPERVDAAS